MNEDGEQTIEEIEEIARKDRFEELIRLLHENPPYEL